MLLKSILKNRKSLTKQFASVDVNEIQDEALKAKLVDPEWKPDFGPAEFVKAANTDSKITPIPNEKSGIKWVS